MFCDHARRVGRPDGNRSLAAHFCQPGVFHGFGSPTTANVLQRGDRRSDPTSRAIAAIGDELRVDGIGLTAVVTQAQEAIAFVRSVAPHFILTHLIGGSVGTIGAGGIGAYA